MIANISITTEKITVAVLILQKNCFLDPTFDQSGSEIKAQKAIITNTPILTLHPTVLRDTLLGKILRGFNFAKKYF